MSILNSIYRAIAPGCRTTHRHSPPALPMRRRRLGVASAWIAVGFGFALAAAARAQGPAFVVTGSLAVPISQTMLLPSGKVLGLLPAGNNLLQTYDPVAGAWAVSGSNPYIASGGVAALLPNGKVLFAGGIVNSVNGQGKTVSATTGAAELYDPANGTWTVTGSMNYPREGHTETVLANGQVLAIGGGYFSGNQTVEVTQCELYDPVSGAWTVTGARTFQSDGYSVTRLQDGRVLLAGGDDANGTRLANAELYNPALGTWSPTGAMTLPRLQPTATLLPSGKVLVVNGDVQQYNTGTETTELYDPVSGTWTATGNLNISRLHGTTSTLLPNGKVIVTGATGASSGTSPLSAELYDPGTGTWSFTANMQHEHQNAGATVLPNGEMLIAGGSDSPGEFDTELYVSGSGTWTPTAGAMSTARVGCTETLLPTGQMLVAGGNPGGNVPLASAELFDPVAATWALTGSMNVARSGQTATLLANGQVLVAGGAVSGSLCSASAEIYDSGSATWTSTASMNTARSSHTATLLPNGQMLVAGGLDSNGNSLASTEIYDPVAATWTPLHNLKTARAGQMATLLPNGLVLVTGGYDSKGTPLASAELFNPALGTWSATGSLNTAREYFTQTLLPSGQVLVAGGVGSAVSASAELYNPATGKWTLTGSLNNARYAHVANLLPNGKVLAMGGTASKGSPPLASAELYDPASGTWTVTGSMNTNRWQFTSALLPDGQMLALGGFSGMFQPSASSELYDVGLGVNAAWQPQIQTATSPLVSGSALMLTGTNFEGVSGASNGTQYDSPSNNPIVQLLSLTNEQSTFLLPDPSVLWSGSSFQSLPVTGFPAGYALATVIANGVPSTSYLIQVSPAPLPFQPPAGNGVPSTSGSSTFTLTGPPSVGAFLGVEQTGTVKTPTIFAADGTVLVQVGGTVSGLPVAKVTTPSGDAALVTLTTGGGVTAASDMALVVGLSSTNPVIAAQTDTAETGLPAGVTIKGFLSIDGNGADTFFLADLQGTGISAANEMALCAAEPGGPINIVAQKGETASVGGAAKTVSLITTLQSSATTADDGRWRIGDSSFGMRATFTDKSEAVFAVPATAASGSDWTFIATTGTVSTIPGLNGTVAATFGLPGFSHNTEAHLMNLTVNKGGIKAADSVALVGGSIGGSLGLLAQTGTTVFDGSGTPIPGVIFATLSDPVSGANGAVAFEGTIKGTGITSRNDTGLWFAADGMTAELLARSGTGAQALAPGGGHWAKFGTMVLPDDPLRGPIFIATLAVSAADAVTAKNNLGLWAVDSTGTLDLLLRTGETAGGKIIGNFTALVPVPGSPGAANGYDSNGDTAAVVTFTDGSTEMVLIQVP